MPSSTGSLGCWRQTAATRAFEYWQPRLQEIDCSNCAGIFGRLINVGAKKKNSTISPKNTDIFYLNDQSVKLVDDLNNYILFVNKLIQAFNAIEIPILLLYAPIESSNFRLPLSS